MNWWLGVSLALNRSDLDHGKTGRVADPSHFFGEERVSGLIPEIQLSVPILTPPLSVFDLFVCLSSLGSELVWFINLVLVAQASAAADLCALAEARGRCTARSGCATAD
jgi:hypothetical protein